MPKPYAYLIVLLCSCGSIQNQEKDREASEQASNANEQTIQSQEPSMSALTNKVFSFGEKRFLRNDCSFYFACDCCNGELVVTTDSMFHLLDYCEGDITLTEGKVSFTDRSVILNFNGKCLIKAYNWERETSSNAVPFLFSDRIIAPSRLEFSSNTCGQKVYLTDDENALLETDRTYLGLVDKIERMKRDVETAAMLEEQNRQQLTITFSEFEVVLDSVEVWDQYDTLSKVQVDTAIVYLELGATMEGQTFAIKQHQQGSLKIFQRFENSVTIMNEGPHCDLTDWKHFDSEWSELIIQDSTFKTETYSKQDWERFVTVDVSELAEAVLEHCGDGWAERADSCKSPNDYPCGVSTSRTFLKFEFQPLKSDARVARIIAFEIPMGC